MSNESFNVNCIECGAKIGATLDVSKVHCGTVCALCDEVRKKAPARALAARVAVKSYRACQGRDGIAWSGKLYVDGKLVATTGNEGSGGCDWRHFMEPTDRAAFEKMAADYGRLAGVKYEPDDQLVFGAIDRQENEKLKAKYVKKGYGGVALARLAPKGGECSGRMYAVAGVTPNAALRHARTFYPTALIEVL